MSVMKSTKTCAAEDNTCKREIRALCLHCSKNLCRIHLMQHAQLIEENTRTELNSLADKLNDLSSRFDHLIISSNFLEQPFTELEKWRLDSHEKIDLMAENKRQKINHKIEEYRIMFAKNNNKRIEEINVSRRMIVELIKDTDASSKQIGDLQASIDSTNKYLNLLNTHDINVVTCPPIWHVDIQTRFFDFQRPKNEKLREFKITYIRFSGIIRHYYVKARQEGTMCDLVQNFIRLYPLLEGLARIELNSSLTISHQPKSDLLWPAEVHDRSIRKSYPVDYKLNLISHDATVVFYETPNSINNEEITNNVIFGNFQRLPAKTPFAWPILLLVPHTRCRGEHVLRAILSTVCKYFPSITQNDQHLCNASLILNFSGCSQRVTRALNNVLQEKIDFEKGDTKLIVYIADEIANAYELNNTE